MLTKQSVFLAPFRSSQSGVLPSHPRVARVGARSLLVVLALFSLLVASSSTAASAQKRGKKNKARSGDQLAFGVDMAGRGLWSEALFRFKQAHRQDPSNAKILNNLAISYEALGLFDQALEHYRMALERDSTNKVLRRNYARFVEFYQSFNPPEEEEGGEAEGDDSAETDARSPSKSDAEDETDGTPPR